jgi:hypothetical protein
MVVWWGECCEWRGVVVWAGLEGVRKTHSLTQNTHSTDIDGFDLALARSVLEAGYRPKVVLMEVNSDVPAPFTFETQFREGWELYFG